MHQGMKPAWALQIAPCRLCWLRGNDASIPALVFIAVQGGSMKRGSIKQGPCVLVVDDHEISRLHTVQALRQVTSRVKQARNGPEAMESALRLLPGLIFMDIHLPGCCGLTLLDQIKYSWPPESPWPAIVILSGDESLDISLLLNQDGVSSILVKPVQAQDIRDVAVRLLYPEQGVQENVVRGSTENTASGLRKIFLKELQTRVPELDRNITNLDWDSARDILHQLIASSAMCQEKELEYSCRQLFNVLLEEIDPRTFARAYYPFLQAASHSGSAAQT